MAKLQGGTTVYGLLSASGVIYASGGNSDQWNSVYTTVSTTSSSWNNKLSLSGGTLSGALSGTIGVFTTSLSSPALSGTHYGDGSKLTGIVTSVGNFLPLSGGALSGIVTSTSAISSANTITANNIATQNQVQYLSSGSVKVYQFYNTSTNTLDTVFN